MSYPLRHYLLKQCLGFLEHSCSLVCENLTCDSQHLSTFKIGLKVLKLLLIIYASTHQVQTCGCWAGWAKVEPPEISKEKRPPIRKSPPVAGCPGAAAGTGAPAGGSAAVSNSKF